jgi:hypothetical protein
MTEETIVRIKHVSELPDWFQLNKYDSAKQLDATGWYEQLLVRYNLLQSFHRLQEYPETEEYNDEADVDTLDFVFAKIQEHPIVDIATDVMLSDLLTEEFIGKTLNELKQKNPHYSLGIHNITVNEFLDIEDAATKSLEQVKQQIKKYTDEINEPDELDNESLEEAKYEWKNNLRTYHDETLAPSLHTPLFKLTNHPILQEAVRINWKLPDTILMEHFKQFIQLHRPKTTMTDDGKSFLKNCYRKPDFNEWYRLGILPCFDLKLWALEENVIIPNRVIADAIYPHGESGEETVRKTTMPLVDKLMSEVALNALAHQSALNMVEQNNE